MPNKLVKGGRVMYQSPQASGPMSVGTEISPMADCTVANTCNWGFGTIAVLGVVGGVLIAVYNPPAIVVAVIA